MTRTSLRHGVGIIATGVAMALAHGCFSGSGSSGSGVLSSDSLGPGYLAAARNTSRFVYPGPDGKLVYVAMDKWDNRIPDYSYAGYRGGGDPIPLVPVRVTIAADDDDADDTPRIQGAIDKLSAMPMDVDGFRGTLLLQAGTYEVAGSLTISASGVVIRGQGQAEAGGTVIRCTYRSEKKASWSPGGWNHNLLTVAAAGKRTEVKPSTQKITDDYVPIGALGVTVDSGDEFKVGDRVLVQRLANARWCHDIMGAPLWTPRKDTGGKGVWDWSKRTARPGLKESYDRVITEIDGDEITFDAPLYNPIAAAHGGGQVVRYEHPGLIANVGVENLRMVSVWQPNAKGLDDQVHSPSAITMPAVEDAWVRDVTLVDFNGTGVTVTGTSARVTIQDCALLLLPDPKHTEGLGHLARYGFNLSAGRTLVQRCFATCCRHAFTSGGHSSGGPRVFLDCRSQGDLGPSGAHHGWVTGDLYDNVRVGGAELQASTHGGTQWRCAQATYWNCGAVAVVCMQPPRGWPPRGWPPIAYNWAIGCYPLRGRDGQVDEHRNFYRTKGAVLLRTGPDIGDGTWDSFSAPVEPRSLYEKQLSDRLGFQAVNAVRQRVDWKAADKQ